MKRKPIITTMKTAMDLTVGTGVFMTVGSIVKAVAPAPVSVPLQIAQTVGVAGLSMLAGHANSKMFNEMFEPLEEWAEKRDAVDILMEENEKLKKQLKEQGD